MKADYTDVVQHKIRPIYNEDRKSKRVIVYIKSGRNQMKKEKRRRKQLLQLMIWEIKVAIPLIFPQDAENIFSNLKRFMETHIF